MNRLVATTLLTLGAGAASLVFAKEALAGIYDVCYPVTESYIAINPADHPGAYAEGYSEGRQNRSHGHAYKPRTAGGEFGRGFEDGYYERPFTGQRYAVPNRAEYYTTQDCDTYYRPYRHWAGRPYYWNRPFYRPWHRW